MEGKKRRASPRRVRVASLTSCGICSRERGEVDGAYASRSCSRSLEQRQVDLQVAQASRLPFAIAERSPGTGRSSHTATPALSETS